MWTYLLVSLTLTDIPTFERFWWEGLWTHLHLNYLRSSCRAPFLDPQALACKTPIWCVYTYVRTYRLLVTLVYHIARAPGPGRPRRLYRVNRNSTAHGMLIASDQTMCALPQDQYQANFTQVWLNVSLVPIEGFHCHLRMRVIDDDSVYVPWSLLT